ncbi:MAG: porin [Pseudomonadota bacterium]
MNKKLLALAIGAVVSLPAAALATGPTLYGQIDLSVENVNVDADTSGLTLDDETPSADDSWVLRDNASRLGVRGEVETNVKDLSGIYQAEFGLEADDGTGPFDQRDIFVGLKGGFGTVKMGNFDTPVKEAQGKVDQFNDSTLDIERYTPGEYRSPDIVQYSSPLIADMITVTVAANTDEEEPGESAATYASVVYDKDGLYIAAAFANDSLAQDGGVDTAGGSEVDVVRVAAGYSTDSMELGALFQTAEGPTDEEDTTMVLSGAMKTGDWKFKAQYGTTEGDLADETVTSLAVGADYALGKSTTLYILAGREELDEAEDDRGVAGFGLRQKF